MADDGTHLIERAAKHLLAGGGLIDPGSATGHHRVQPGPVEPKEGASHVSVTGRAGPADGEHDAALSEHRSSGQRMAAAGGDADALPEDRSSSLAGVDVAPVLGASGAMRGEADERAAEPLIARAAMLESAVAAPRQQVEQPSGKLLDISHLERGGMVVGRKSRTRISEEFRIAVGHVLRSLQNSYTAGHGSANLIMVTSSRPGEGKSFTAMNLAGCIAQQNQREVLLVDIDAKQRPITFELGLGDAPGLLDLVRDPAIRIEDVIVPTSIPSLSFLPIGARLTSNAEMPLSRPISAVVERLGRRFANRVIILDAPPCLSTSDPSALAPIVGQILMVVEAERTQRNELVAALEMVRVCPSITLLLNKIQLTTSYTFGAYHYFGTYS